uniref:Uncharacterized protein n=1 Tax=Romanomermis culicivorax TaxID=13658 RepID=A0A915K759_ROMCU
MKSSSDIFAEVDNVAIWSMHTNFFSSDGSFGTDFFDDLRFLDCLLIIDKMINSNRYPSIPSNPAQIFVNKTIGKWTLKIVRNCENMLTSTVNEFFINLIKPLFHLYGTLTCSNRNCLNKEVVNQIDMLNKKTEGKMDKFVGQELSKHHDQCKQRLGDQRCGIPSRLSNPTQ